MPFSDEFVDYVIDQLAGWGQVSARKMFVGASLCRNEVMSFLLPNIEQGIYNVQGRSEHRESRIEYQSHH